LSETIVNTISRPPRLSTLLGKRNKPLGSGIKFSAAVNKNKSLLANKQPLIKWVDEGSMPPLRSVFKFYNSSQDSSLIWEPLDYVYAPRRTQGKIFNNLNNLPLEMRPGIYPSPETRYQNILKIEPSNPFKIAAENQKTQPSPTPSLPSATPLIARKAIENITQIESNKPSRKAEYRPQTKTSVPAPDTRFATDTRKRFKQPVSESVAEIVKSNTQLETSHFASGISTRPVDIIKPAAHAQPKLNLETKRTQNSRKDKTLVIHRKESRNTPNARSVRKLKIHANKIVATNIKPSFEPKHVSSFKKVFETQSIHYQLQEHDNLATNLEGAHTVFTGLPSRKETKPELNQIEIESVKETEISPDPIHESEQKSLSDSVIKAHEITVNPPTKRIFEKIKRNLVVPEPKRFDQKQAKLKFPAQNILSEGETQIVSEHFDTAETTDIAEVQSSGEPRPEMRFKETRSNNFESQKPAVPSEMPEVIQPLAHIQKIAENIKGNRTTPEFALTKNTEIVSKFDVVDAQEESENIIDSQFEETAKPEIADRFHLPIKKVNGLQNIKPVEIPEFSEDSNIPEIIKIWSRQRSRPLTESISRMPESEMISRTVAPGSAHSAVSNSTAESYPVQNTGEAETTLKEEKSPDLDAIARSVYGILKKRLLRERERSMGLS
jgi:hypothetical protein